MPEVMNLDSTHLDYKIISPIRKKAIILLAGSEAVKAVKEEFLFKGSQEPIGIYNNRLKRSIYSNWGMWAVLYRIAMLWKTLPVRVLPLELESLIEDIDLKGNHINSFMKEGTTVANEQGMVFILVDMPEGKISKDGKTVEINGEVFNFPLSKENETALNHRPFWQLIPASDVLDWKLDRGKLEWCVVRQHVVTESLPGFSPEIENKRIVWYPDKREIYKKEESGEWKKFETIDNPLGEIPIVPLYGLKERDFLGKPVIVDIVDHIVALYNKGSDKDYFEWLTTNPFPVFITSEKLHKVSTTYGAGVRLDSSAGKQTDAKYLEVTGKGSEVSRDSINDTIIQMAEIVFRQTRPDTTAVQSDKTLKADRYIYNANLVSATILNEQAETKAWKLTQKWIDNTEKIEISYNRRFEFNSVTEEIAKIFSEMQSRRQLSKETLLKLLQSGGILDENIVVDEEISRIESDGDNDGMPGFNNDDGAE